MIDVSKLGAQLSNVRLSLPENARLALQSIRRALLIAQQEAGDFGGRAKEADGWLGGLGQVFGASTELPGKTARAKALANLDRQLADLESGPVNVPAVRDAVLAAAREVNDVSEGNATLAKAGNTFSDEVSKGLRDVVEPVAGVAGAAGKFALSVVPWYVWGIVALTVGGAIYLSVRK